MAADFKHIDIKGGKMTYGQRIQLGSILSKDCEDVIMFEEVFDALHDYKPTAKDYANLVPYFKEIIEGIIYWIEQEKELLAYEPTQEEIRAGARELSEKIGEFGTVKSLAKSYGKDPDDIFLWEYGKVFGILYTDLEEYKYQVRYQKIMQKKTTND